MTHDTLARMFWNRVERSGAKPAQQAKRDGKWITATWSQVGQAVRELAVALIASGRKKGDAVGILSQSRAEWVQADFAIFSAGCVTIPIYPSYPPDLIQYIVNDAGVKTLFVEDPAQLAKVLEVQGKMDGLEQIVVIQGYEGELSAQMMTWDGLRRLGRDTIDLYQLHIGDLPLEEAALLRDECEALVAAGKIRAYGWSTDDVERARFFAAGEHGIAAQADINLLFDNPEMYAGEYSVLCRRPLAMGLLARETFTELPADDVRVTNPSWLRFFVDGKPSPEYFQAREAVRDVLTSGGRTLVQGALAWFWARSPRLIPIPGIRTVEQAEENAGALAKGPLTADQLAEIDRVLGR